MKRDKHGFRLRGTEMTRIETFTDAAFAFALTLLAISSNPITSFDQFPDMLRMVPVFLLSGTMLMLFWWGHHEWSRRYGLDDGPTIILSTLLVFTMLVYVYPLRYVFGTFMHFVGFVIGVDLGHPDFELNDRGNSLNTLFTIYGAGFVVMSGLLAMLNQHAWRKRTELELDEREMLLTELARSTWLIIGSVGLASLVISLVAPASWYGAPGWAYATLSIIMPVYGARAGRRLKALDAAAQAR